MDHLDEIIEGVLGHKPGKAVSINTNTLRAVAEAAYEKGGCDALDIAIQAGPSVTEKARRELARELLDLDAKNIEELSADPVWGEKSIVDQVYAQHRRMADKLREIAEGEPNGDGP